MNYDCLVIDDEKELADSTAEYFNLFGVNTAVVYSVAESNKFFTHSTAKLLLLDINLGDGSGFSLCKKLRESTQIPILFISARTSEDDQIIALNIGGDDYIQKPYSLSVLLAKVKAVLKRYGSDERHIWSDGRVVIDFNTKLVTVGDKTMRFKAMEYKLLSYLVANAGRVISKAELFENVWGDKFTGDGTLNVHVRRLRECIEQDANNPHYIKTVWGDGYIFYEAKL